MRTALALVLASIIGLTVYACGDGDGGDHDAFPTFEDCFTDHHVTEMFTIPKAITICCLDHPIGTAAAGVVCGADATSCGTYVTAQLGSAAGSGDVTSGCTDYVTQKGM